MAENKTSILTEDPEVVVERAKNFWEKNGKKISTVGIIIILLIGGWFGYKNFIVEPKEKAAAEAIFPAENLFETMASTEFNKDSVNKVLNGGELDGNKITGLLKIISTYEGTEAGNRAKYLVGACYFHIKEFDKAIKYLKDFDAHGAKQLESRTHVILGHIYAEKNAQKEALDYYKKAASVNEKDETMSVSALILAARYARAIGEKKEAINLFTQLKDKYPNADFVLRGDVDKNLASLGELK